MIKEGYNPSVPEKNDHIVKEAYRVPIDETPEANPVDHKFIRAEDF